VGAGGGLVTLGGRSAAVGGAGANAANVPNAADVATVPNAASDIAIADPADRAEGPRAAGRVRFISPFALGTAGGADSADAVAAGWLPAAEMEEIPLGGVLRREIGGRDLLLSRTGDAILCFTNACAHLAMPLDEGAIADGVITCPFHGFQYLLESGECLTAPAVQLEQHAVRLIDNRVEIRLSR
jgi:nitrite reductase/ring-hydroxylating ferredoxin subunit